MPTYDYECSACDHHVEIFHKITDDPIKKCPACGKNKLVRQFGTGAAIVFKGSGFYQTDYRSDGYKKSAESDKKQSESGGSSDKTEKSDKAMKSEGSSSSSSSDSSSGKSESKPKPDSKKNKSGE
jgi:putative FmdB family regulatory protein